MAETRTTRTFVWFPCDAFSGYVVMTAATLGEALEPSLTDQLPDDIRDYVVATPPNRTLLCPSAFVFHANPSSTPPAADTDHL